MKSIILYAYFLVMAFTSSGCDKETLISEITISNSQTHFQDLNICGDEEGAVIEVQAEHVEESRIVRDITTGFCVFYFYKPEAGYTGKDFVRIRTNTGSNGASKGQTKYVEINFTVTN
ncbi:MAG TPA: hypothetical protein VFG10_10630 [Saprospiraceae bacterium]|nr:hypothetical protein [Saprospiraceae bacterium]